MRRGRLAAILEINPVNVRQYLSRLYGKFGVIDLYGLQGLFAKTRSGAGGAVFAGLARIGQPAPGQELLNSSHKGCGAFALADRL